MPVLIRPGVARSLWRTPHEPSAALGAAYPRVEVEYRQRLKDGLRHAALKGLRPEKKPGLIRRSPLSDRGPF